MLDGSLDTFSPILLESQIKIEPIESENETFEELETNPKPESINERLEEPETKPFITSASPQKKTYRKQSEVQFNKRFRPQRTSKLPERFAGTTAEDSILGEESDDQTDEIQSEIQTLKSRIRTLEDKMVGLKKKKRKPNDFMNSGRKEMKLEFLKSDLLDEDYQLIADFTSRTKMKPDELVTYTRKLQEKTKKPSRTDANKVKKRKNQALPESLDDYLDLELEYFSDDDYDFQYNNFQNSVQNAYDEVSSDTCETDFYSNLNLTFSQNESNKSTVNSERSRTSRKSCEAWSTEESDFKAEDKRIQYQRPLRTCPIEDCDVKIFYLSKHLKNCHSDLTSLQRKAVLEKDNVKRRLERADARKKLAKGKKARRMTWQSCSYNGCSFVGIRLDRHIKRKHSGDNNNFMNVFNNNKVKDESHWDIIQRWISCFVPFQTSLVGSRRTLEHAVTSANHIKTFLMDAVDDEQNNGEPTFQTFDKLMDIGKKNGWVDVQLRNNISYAEVQKIISSFIRFLKFLKLKRLAELRSFLNIAKGIKYLRACNVALGHSGLTGNEESKKDSFKKALIDVKNCSKSPYPGLTVSKWLKAFQTEKSLTDSSEEARITVSNIYTVLNELSVSNINFETFNQLLTIEESGGWIDQQLENCVKPMALIRHILSIVDFLKYLNEDRRKASLLSINIGKTVQYLLNSLEILQGLVLQYNIPIVVWCSFFNSHFFADIANLILDSEPNIDQYTIVTGSVILLLHIAPDHVEELSVSDCEKVFEECPYLSLIIFEHQIISKNMNMKVLTRRCCLKDVIRTYINFWRPLADPQGNEIFNTLTGIPMDGLQIKQYAYEAWKIYKSENNYDVSMSQLENFEANFFRNIINKA